MQFTNGRGGSRRLDKLTVEFKVSDDNVLKSEQQGLIYIFDILQILQIPLFYTYILSYKVDMNLL